MSKQKSEILSGAGVAFEILKKITDAVLAAGGSDFDVRKVLDKKYNSALKKIADALLITKIGNLEWSREITPADDCFLDYHQALKQITHENFSNPEAAKPWRLPTEDELIEAFQMQERDGFCFRQNEPYWTSSPSLPDDDYDRMICVDDGLTSFHLLKTEKVRLRLVR